MQPFAWYIRRLKRMGPTEVLWRTHGAMRDLADRAMLSRRQRPRPLEELLGGTTFEPPFRVTDMTVGAWADPAAAPRCRRWLQRLGERADRIAEHRLTLFHAEDLPLGSVIDWNCDPILDVPAPRAFAPWIDYRDVRVTGDCKHVWEPSRHLQLVVLARAYRASGQQRYAQAVVDQADSWMEQCPFGIGMQWRSGLELAVRLINWVWAIDLVRESGLVAGGFLERLANSVVLQAWEIRRKISRGSSANNHRIGELAGLYVASSYFGAMGRIGRWRSESRDMLIREALAQTFCDGGNRELSTNYHLFVLQFLLAAGLVGRWSGDEFPPEYWQTVWRMMGFLAAMHEGGDRLPMLGDADDGHVLDLGSKDRRVEEWLAVSAALNAAEGDGICADRDGEVAHWLVQRGAVPALAPQPDKQRRQDDCFDQFAVEASGRTSPASAIAPAAPAAAQRDGGELQSRAFAESGYYLLQSGQDRGRISVLFDCGPLGLAPLAGHGHADALSFTLRAFGQDVLVDPGTFDYFTYPRWRSYFRGTRAHNTLLVDGQDQSVAEGLFLWGQAAEACCRLWRPASGGGLIEAEHDGYTRLRDPLVHRRTLELRGDEQRVMVRDELIAMGEHEVELNLHFAEHCRLSEQGAGCYCVDLPGGAAVVNLDAQFTSRVYVGSDDPPAGWVSRGYHRKTPSPTLRASCRIRGPASFTTWIVLIR